MSRKSSENGMRIVTIEQIFALYFERMALFSYSGREAGTLQRRYVSQHQGETDAAIRDILRGKYPMNYILGLMPTQRKDAVVAMATYIVAVNHRDWKYLNSIIDAVIRDEKKNKSEIVELDGISWVLSQVFARNDFQFAAYAFGNGFINPPTRAFFLAAIICKNMVLGRPEQELALTAAYCALYTSQMAIMGSEFATNNKVFLKYLITVASKDIFRGNNLGHIFREDTKTYNDFSSRKRFSQYLHTFKERMRVSFNVITNLMLNSGILQESSMDSISFSKAKKEELCSRAMFACNLDSTEFDYNSIAAMFLDGKKPDCSEEDLEQFNRAVDEFKIALHYIVYLSAVLEMHKKNILSYLDIQIFNQTEKALSAKLCSTQQMLEQEREKTKEAKRNLQTAKKECADVNSQIREMKNKNAGLQAKVEKQEREIQNLMRELEAYRNGSTAPGTPETTGTQKQNEEKQEDDTMSAAVAAPSLGISVSSVAEKLKQIFSEHKIVFIGGNVNLMKKFAAAHPNAIVISKARVANADELLENADAVLMKTDSIGHKETGKAKGVLNRCNVPYAYLKDVTNMGRLEDNVYDTLKGLGF